MMHWRLAVDLLMLRLNASTLAAGAMLALVIAVAAWHLVRLDIRAAAAESALAAARSHDSRLSVATTNARHAERLAQFERTLGKRSELDAQLQAMFAVGQRRGLTLPAGQYQLVWDDAGMFWRYRVQLPVTGDFTAIQVFIRDVLAELPFVALEEASMRRDSVNDQRVEARLRFTLFLADDRAASRSAVGRGFDRLSLTLRSRSDPVLRYRRIRVNGFRLRYLSPNGVGFSPNGVGFSPNGVGFSLNGVGLSLNVVGLSLNGNGGAVLIPSPFALRYRSASTEGGKDFGPSIQPFDTSGRTGFSFDTPKATRFSLEVST